MPPSSVGSHSPRPRCVFCFHSSSPCLFGSSPSINRTGKPAGYLCGVSPSKQLPGVEPENYSPLRLRTFERISDILSSATRFASLFRLGINHRTFAFCRHTAASKSTDTVQPLSRSLPSSYFVFKIMASISSQCRLTLRLSRTPRKRVAAQLCDVSSKQRVLHRALWRSAGCPQGFARCSPRFVGGA